jgi:hypothetical protein
LSVKKARAALGAVVGITLTATGVLAASSAVSTVAQDHADVGGPNDNHGGAVSTVAKGTNGVPDTTTPGSTGPNTTTDTTEPAGTQGAHGAAVSAVAQDPTAVGGPNDNHGGAVSLVARGTHGPSATHGKSAGKSQGAAHRPTH